MKKQVDPTDTYIVRELFGCGHGHFMAPGWTHWESGEACPHGHSLGPGDPEPSARDTHLYWRLIAVPTQTSAGEDMWSFMLTVSGKWGHLPLAPEGMKAGDVIEPVEA